MSPVRIDASAAATDTISYLATDTWGNTATATRTVLIEATQSPGSPATSTPVVTPAPPSDSPSTEDNSSAQPATSTEKISTAQ